MKVLGTLLTSLVIVALSATAFVYSGWYNVAATEPHAQITRKVLEITMKNSVTARAKDIAVPDLSAPDMVKRGASHYSGNCAVCHGAPGVERGAIGKGLMPRPPNLAERAPHWNPAELYWIVKHGIRMTGMPAWGETHKEYDLWAIVSFLVRMPKLSAEDYRRLAPEGTGQHAQHAR